MAQLALKGLNYAGQNLPDSAFDKIPVVGPRFFREKEREEKEKLKEQNRRARDSGDESERDRRHYHHHHGKRSPRDRRPSSISRSGSSSETEYESDRRPTRPRRNYRTNSRRYRDDFHDRGYESADGRPRQFPAEVPYFPPPPTRAFNDPPEEPMMSGAANYDPPPTSYVPPQYEGPVPPSEQPYLAANNQPPPPNSDTDPSQHSSIADRYRPKEYEPYSDRGTPGSSPRPNYGTALAIRQASPYTDSRNYDDYQRQPQYDTYEPPYDEYDSHRRLGRSPSESPPRHRSRSQAKSKSNSRTRSLSRATSRARETYDKHKKEVLPSALGALAGGFIGNELTKKTGKGKFGMFVGAAIGGVGAGLLEKRHEDRKRKKEAKKWDDDGYESY